MATIELRLSKKEQKETGRCEVLIRLFHGRRVDMYAKSEVLINPNYFEFYIDREKTAKYGIAVPGNAVTCTKAVAEKKGYVLRNSGEIVIKKRIATPDVAYHREQLKRIKDMKKVIMDAFEQVSDKKSISGDWLTTVVDKFNHPEKYIPKEEAKKTFFDLGMEYIAKNNFSEGFSRTVKVLIRDVIRFEGYVRETENKDFVFDVEKVTREDIEALFDYLAHESELADEQPRIFKQLAKLYPESVCYKTRKVYTRRSDNYLISLKKKMRALFVWLRENGYTQNRPMDDMRVGMERYGTPFYITIDERNQIADFDLSGRHALEVQRDIFIFQCFAGCRVSDLMRLTKDNIHEGFLSYAPHKTKDEGAQTLVARLPLSPKAIALVEKYDGIDKSGRLFPFIAPQKYNQAIKEIFALAGITRNVVVRNSKTGEDELRPINEVASSHLARRTFIGNTYFKSPDPNIIGKMSGHAEGSKAFSRYRKIEDKTLIDVAKTIW